jgi:hypothetical protein
MSTPTKKSREDVEGIMAASTPATLLALLQTFVSILIVHLSRLRVRERFVGFGDFNELLFCRCISTGYSLVFCVTPYQDFDVRILVRMVFLAKFPVCAFDIPL